MSPTRREFLQASAGAAALASLGTCPDNFSLAAGPSGKDERVLVIVELAGGNDGLNTVVPFENDVYARSRTSLRLTGKDVLKIDDQLGFHPALKGFRRLFDEGSLSVVQGVGYPNPNGGHDGAMMDWQSGRPNQTNRQTGWVGRAIDDYAQRVPVCTPAAVIGQTKRPFCVNAEKTIVPLIGSLADCTLKPSGDANDQAGHRHRLTAAAQLPRTAPGNPFLDTMRENRLAACASARRVEEVLRSAPSANYPRFRLAGQLSMVSQLIRADSGIRIFYTGFGGDGIGGFDNHANQRDNHASLLRHMSESVAAFVDDLKRQNLLDRVVLMTFSEFGRTLKENGRKGTGHASAAPVFLAGGKLKGGLVGEHPSLAELENGGPKHHTDFRRVYATVLKSWLGIDSRPAVGKDFKPLDVFRA